MDFLIILAGPKHSGKTCIGRQLAKLLSIRFYDLDQLIEEQSGQSVRVLYKAGKEFFQEETTALECLLQKKKFEEEKSRGAVLALGGGIIDNPGAMAVLKKELQKSERYRIVCLEVSAETAWQRIVGRGELPPFLMAENPAASKEKHRLLHERRANDYKKIASFSILAEGKSAVELAARLSVLLTEK